MALDSNNIILQVKLLNIQSANSTDDDTMLCAPVFTVPSLVSPQSRQRPPTQYGLLGGTLPLQSPSDGRPEIVDRESRLFSNTTAPSSTFICGSQGSGKSHTLSCLLENYLSASGAAVLPNPLTAIVFHYDTFISDDGGSPCEAAYLSSLANVRVRVLCAPTNVATIRVGLNTFPNICSVVDSGLERTYARLNVEVQPLQLKDSDLNTKRMLDLMAANTDDNSTPLYIHVVHRILREMRMEQQLTGGSFDYNTFKRKIADADLTPAQLLPLSQRLSVLESFMWSSAANKKRKKQGQEVFAATTWSHEVCSGAKEISLG